MSEIKNGGLDQYGAGPFEQQQFGTAGVEWVNTTSPTSSTATILAPPRNRPRLLANYSVKPSNEQQRSSLRQPNKYMAVVPTEWDDDVLLIILAALCWTSCS